MLDVLTVLFWTIAYILIIIHGFRSLKSAIVYMPILSGGLNLAWEINAWMASGGLWGHVIWTLLDVIIFAINFILLLRRKRVFAALYLVGEIVVIISLEILFCWQDGMLITVFVIDFIMAIEYFLEKDCTARGKGIIGVLRLLGDLCAWIMCNDNLIIVFLLGSGVLLLNLLYLNKCYQSRGNTNKEVSKV